MNCEKELPIRQLSTQCIGLSTVGISFLLASIAFGQVAPRRATTNDSIAYANITDPGADAAASSPSIAVETDRIIITGSNIPTAEEVGANPMLTIGRELIDKSGERTAAELIKNLPEATANGVPISNNAAGFTQGASSVSLRGFDPDATVVLIDGRRVAPYPIGTGTGTQGIQSFVDLNSIPTAAIQSVEVLKDGRPVLGKRFPEIHG